MNGRNDFCIAENECKANEIAWEYEHEAESVVEIGVGVHKSQIYFEKGEQLRNEHPNEEEGKSLR